MSHIVKIDVVITDLDAAAAAAKRMGGELVRDQKTYKWYGLWVGDTPMPESMKVSDMGKCDHAIRFKNAAYEVGLSLDPTTGHYRIHYDYWDYGGLAPIMGKDAGRFKQAYALEKAAREARRLGHRVIGERLEQNGNITLLVEARR